MRNLRHSLFITLFVALLSLTSCRSAGEFGSETDQLINRSRITFKSMMSDNQYPGLVDLASRAKAIIIVPSQLRAAFIFGGSGGNAVMLVRDSQNKWSPPAFYTLGGISFGLQIGGNSSEIIIAIMTERGLNAVLDRQVTLGADAGLAIGELGKGVNASTAIGLKADMYAFARSEGLYLGASLEGSVIAPRHTWNRQMYGTQVSPRNILIDRSVSSNSQSVSSLIAAMP
ncbi:MAG: lipid-binding SYLF domain-containing protein [Alphaproteobacteria bacterium]|nr:lipid-binding SYLF domain-containing protein [Alphaproteobacteria bacterium]